MRHSVLDPGDVYEAAGLVGSDEPLSPAPSDAPPADASSILRAPVALDVRRIADDLQRRRLNDAKPLGGPGPAASVPRAPVASPLPAVSQPTEALVRSLASRCSELEGRVGPTGKSFASSVSSLHRLVALLHPSGAAECAARVDAAMRLRLVSADPFAQVADDANASKSRGAAEGSNKPLWEAVKLLKDVSERTGELEQLASRMATLQPLHSFAVSRADSILRLAPSADATTAGVAKARTCLNAVGESVDDSRAALRESLEAFKFRLDRVKRHKKKR